MTPEQQFELFKVIVSTISSAPVSAVLFYTVYKVYTDLIARVSWQEGELSKYMEQSRGSEENKPK